MAADTDLPEGVPLVLVLREAAGSRVTAGGCL